MNERGVDTEIERLIETAQQALEAGDRGRVIIACDEVLRREPAQVDALFLAGTAFLGGGNPGLALQMFNTARAATQDERKLAAVWNNIGACLQDNHPAEAYKALIKALEYSEPRETYDNLCNVSSQIGRHAEALDWADKSERESRKDASYNRSFALFSLGRWREAWAAFDKAIPNRDGAARSFGFPRWDGKTGRPVIHGEQGIGDEILFLSMLKPDFDGVIECNARNAALVQRSFPAASVYGTLGESMIDWCEIEEPTHEIEMGGLGTLFAPEPFRRGAFLKADPAKVAMFRAWLDGAAKQPIRVGVAWTGGSWSTGRLRRSLPFELVMQLLSIPGVTPVCLEYDDRTKQLEPWKHVLYPKWAVQKGADFDDTAALVSSLDLVISATTSVVDLCGALGVECWAMVDAHPQWRYSPAAGKDRMWFYESVRTFRQRPDETGWGRVVSEVRKAALERFPLERAA
jgi:hypothetical protein